MAEYISQGQSNYGWSLTWDAAGRYPIIAKRRFETLNDAQSFVNDTSSLATATEGLIISVFNDSTAKNNGVYWVEYVANNDSSYGAIHDTGKLVKVGGTETEIVEDYSEALELSKNLAVGQLIKVSKPETVNGQEYKAGFYIVNGSGSISALGTSTGADDEIGALSDRIEAIESQKDSWTAAATAINTFIANAELDAEGKNVIDTLKELQSHIAQYGEEGVTGLIDRIVALESNDKTHDTEIATLKSKDNTHDTEIATLKAEIQKIASTDDIDSIFEPKAS